MRLLICGLLVAATFIQQAFSSQDIAEISDSKSFLVVSKNKESEDLYNDKKFPIYPQDNFEGKNNSSVYLKSALYQRGTLYLDYKGEFFKTITEEPVLLMHFWIIRKKDNKYVGYLKAGYRLEHGNSICMEAIEPYNGFKNEGYNMDGVNIFTDLVESSSTDYPNFKSYMIRLDSKDKTSLLFYEKLGFNKWGTSLHEPNMVIMEKQKKTSN